MENLELIARALEYARGNYADEDLSVQSVAEHAGFSIDYFNRMFLAHTGFTVMAYINYLRLKKAVELLRCSDKTVLEIALEVGYDSHEGFLKAFKKAYGIPPSRYRSQNRNQILSLGELVDGSCLHRFLHENRDFQGIDPERMIDRLLEKDRLRYAPFCARVKYMGYQIAVSETSPEKGLLAIGDDRRGGMYMEALSDDSGLLGEWISRFENLRVIHSTLSPDTVGLLLREGQCLEPIPQSVYLAGQMPCCLPENITIRQLTAGDMKAVLQWAGGKTDGYILHLLNEQHYLDPSVLEYGVFEDGALVAVAGCGIDEIRGLRLNDGCHIRFAEGKSEDALYRQIFCWVVNDLLGKGVVPFDDLQYGAFARTHGGFTVEELDFTTVSWRYVLRQEA